MAEIHVSSESLSAGASRLNSGADRLQGLLAELQGTVQDLGGNWSGTGAAAFHELYSQFNAAGQRINESLLAISVMLNQASEYYSESEAQVTRAFRG